MPKLLIGKTRQQLLRSLLNFHHLLMEMMTYRITHFRQGCQGPIGRRVLEQAVRLSFSDCVLLSSFSLPEANVKHDSCNNLIDCLSRL